MANHIETFRNDGSGTSFRGWLWTVTRNKFRDHFRRLKSRTQATRGSAAQELSAQIPEALPELSAASLGDHSFLHRALDLIRPEFEETSGQAFWRMTVEGHSAADVAADSGLTKKAVRQAKYRVLQRLLTGVTGERLVEVTCFGEAGYEFQEPLIEHIEIPKWYETDMLPKPLRHEGGGHDGSHPFQTHEFIDALLSNRRPAVDVYEAVAYTAPGIVAHQSSLRDGEQLKMPAYRPRTATARWLCID